MVHKTVPHYRRPRFELLELQKLNEDNWLVPYFHVRNSFVRLLRVSLKAEAGGAPSHPNEVCQPLNEEGCLHFSRVKI